MCHVYELDVYYHVPLSTSAYLIRMAVSLYSLQHSTERNFYSKLSNR